MTTTPTATTTTTQPDAPNRKHVRLAALIGLAGALLSFVGWAFMLSNPAEGTGRWYAGFALGGAAMIATTILLLGMLAAGEAGAHPIGRGILALWPLGQLILLAGGVQALAGNYDTILFPIGGITAGVASLIAAIFIAINRRLTGPRRWAPLTYAVGGVVTSFFQGDEHTLRVNLADLSMNLLMVFVAASFYHGVRSTPEPKS